MNKVVTVIGGLIVIATLYGLYFTITRFEELTLLRLNKEGLEFQRDEYKRKYENSDSICAEKIKKEVKRQKDLRDAKDKINNPDSGIVILPLGVRR